VNIQSGFSNKLIFVIEDFRRPFDLPFLDEIVGPTSTVSNEEISLNLKITDIDDPNTPEIESKQWIISTKIEDSAAVPLLNQEIVKLQELGSLLSLISMLVTLFAILI